MKKLYSLGLAAVALVLSSCGHHGGYGYGGGFHGASSVSLHTGNGLGYYPNTFRSFGNFRNTGFVNGVRGGVVHGKVPFKKQVVSNSKFKQPSFRQRTVNNRFNQSSGNRFNRTSGTTRNQRPSTFNRPQNGGNQNRGSQNRGGQNTQRSSQPSRRSSGFNVASSRQQGASRTSSGRTSTRGATTRGGGTRRGR